MSEVFSPYQIDYSVKNTSKTFGFSKKRITFKFGIANPPAVANGETGANCRGSEHEVIFTWSLNSGKRQILLDGKDVHYSETGQNGWTADQVFQHSWQFRVAGLSGPLRAHLITQPANKDVPHIKPFDLRINGISYFAMPKIFELGGPQMIVRPVKGGGPQKKGGYGGGGSGGGRYGGGRGGDDDAYLSPAEREAIAAAKLASMQDLNRSGAGAGGHPSAAPPAPAVEDLISFDAPAPAPAYGQQPPPMQQRQYSNYSIGSSVNSASGAGAGAGSQYSQQSYPGAYGQQQQQLQQQQQQQPFYGQPPPPQPPSQPQAFYGQQPPPALAPNGPPTPSFDPHAMASPSNQSIASYQSYGSAPSFAQPPSQQQQQQQRPPPQMQQQQQQYPPQGGYYGQQPQRY
eukprot:jgi/Psemu1/2462/gm1.2462_g